MANPSEVAPLLGSRPATTTATANGRHHHPRGHGAEPAVERAPLGSPLLRPDALRRPSQRHPGHQHDPHHHEEHSSNGDMIRDMTIGFADGLTVPFALTAGLSSLGSTKLVVIGGLAELFSGMISMGLGAYLAAATERQHWEAEYERERWEVDHCPDREREEIYEVLAKYGISRPAARAVVDELCVTGDPKREESWLRFMMDFELQLPEPDTSAAWVSAVTMGLSYFAGGLIPMIPYFVMHSAAHALLVSIAITVVILLAFGYVKTYVTIHNKRAGVWGALHTLLVGALAAATSYAIVRLLDSGHGSV